MPTMSINQFIFFFSKLREIVSRGLGMTIEYIIGYSVLNLKSFILELSIFKVPFWWILPKFDFRKRMFRFGLLYFSFFYNIIPSSLMCPHSNN